MANNRLLCGELPCSQHSGRCCNHDHLDHDAAARLARDVGFISGAAAASAINTAVGLALLFATGGVVGAIYATARLARATGYIGGAASAIGTPVGLALLFATGGVAGAIYTAVGSSPFSIGSAVIDRVVNNANAIIARHPGGFCY